MRDDKVELYISAGYGNTESIDYSLVNASEECIAQGTLAIGEECTMTDALTTLEPCDIPYAVELRLSPSSRGPKTYRVISIELWVV